MKIALVSHAFLPEGTGGVELRVYYLAREYARLGHRVRVFTRGGDAGREDYAVEDFEHDGVPVRRVNYNFRDSRSFGDVYVNRKIELLFDEWLREDRPDVVDFHHMTCLSTTLPEVCERRDVADLIELHDLWLGCPRGQRIRPDSARCDTIDRALCLPCLEKIWGRKFLAPPAAGVSILQRLLKGNDPLKLLKDYDLHVRRTLASADRLVTPSEHTRTKYVEMGVPPDRIHATPYGLPTERFRDVRRTPSEKTRVGYLGSIIPPKGAHVLVEAFRRLERDDVVLDLYGAVLPYHGDSSYEPHLRDLAGKDPRVTLHGRYENADLKEILERIDVLVVPSIWWETFCITIREGFLGRIPVVASRLGALEEAIEDGVTGLLFEPGDPDDLARTLARLLDDRALRERLVRGSFERVKGIARNAEEMLEHYRAAVDVRSEKMRARAAR